MRPSRWFASPLAATAAVLGSLTLLAIPLQRLTSGRQTVTPPVAAPPAAAHQLPAVLRLKRLDPLSRLSLAQTDGKVLWQSGPLEAGESEHDLVVNLDHGICEWIASAETGNTETAVFFTLMPDGYEERTAFVTGSGMIEETLRFEWPAPESNDPP